MVNKKSKKKSCPKGSRRNSKTNRCRKVKSKRSLKLSKSRKTNKQKKSNKPKKYIKKKSTIKKSIKKTSKSRKLNKPIITKKNNITWEGLNKMNNSEVRKYLNSLPRYSKNYTNYKLWKDNLSPNVYIYWGLKLK